MNEELLAKELLRDEGSRLKMYKDSVGKWTIGVGRNIEDRGIRPDEQELMLKNDIDDHCALLDKYLPWWRNLDEVRQRVVANMAFNLGVGPSEEDPKGKLLTFKGTLAAIEAGAWEKAAVGMESSLWAKQVGPRADRLVAMMRTGEVA